MCHMKRTVSAEWWHDRLMFTAAFIWVSNSVPVCCLFITYWWCAQVHAVFWLLLMYWNFSHSFVIFAIVSFSSKHAAKLSTSRNLWPVGIYVAKISAEDSAKKLSYCRELYNVPCRLKTYLFSRSFPSQLLSASGSVHRAYSGLVVIYFRPL